jgi:hypothetical protein
VKVVTFGGHFYHFDELKKLIKYDYVFVDVKHVYGADEHTFDGINVVEVVTDENDNKYVCIAKTVIQILNEVNDDVLILDSDVYVPVDLVPRTSDTVVSICIPAVDWSRHTYVLYCHSTNMYIPRKYRMTIITSLESYIKKPSVPVDTFLNMSIPIPIKRVVIPGTFHYLPLKQDDYANAKKWVIQKGHILNVGDYAMLPCDYILL